MGPIRSPLGRWIDLSDHTSLIRILHDQPLATHRIFEDTPLGNSYPADADALLQYQAFDQHQLFFIDRHDQRVILFPRCAALAHRFTGRFVLDLDFLADAVDFDAPGHLFDDRANDDFSALPQLLVDDEPLFAQLYDLLLGAVV